MSKVEYKYTPEELQKIIDDYFDSIPFLEWRVTALALAVGGKQLLCDYGRRDKYKKMVEIARLKVEDSYEADLRKRGGSHNIFALKNFGWKDSQDIDMNHSHTGPATIIFTDNSKKDEQED